MDVTTAKKLQQWPIEKLVPYGRNSRTHSQEQIEQVAASIQEFGFTNPILVDSAAGIIAGHGRLAAAKLLGLKKVPVIVLGHLTDEQRRAYVITDNQLALNAGWDEDILRLEMAELGEAGFNLSLLGFNDEDLASLTEEASSASSEDQSEAENPYTKKIDVAPYAKTGEKPETRATFDDAKTNQLLAAIEASTLPEQERYMLRLAAYRHVVFDFQEMASLYAHAEPELQRLMEDSALVIVDMEKAIASGWARLRSELDNIYAQEKAEEAENDAA